MKQFVQDVVSHSVEAAQKIFAQLTGLLAKEINGQGITGGFAGIAGLGGGSFLGIGKELSQNVVDVFQRSAALAKDIVLGIGKQLLGDKSLIVGGVDNTIGAAEQLVLNATMNTR